MTGFTDAYRNLNVNKIFCYQVANDTFDGPDPNKIKQAMNQPDWPKWKEAFLSELKRLNSRSVFSEVVDAPPGLEVVGHRRVFTKKRKDKSEVVKYKARLVAQLQFCERDYLFINSPVMDGTTYRFVFAFAKLESQ